MKIKKILPAVCLVAAAHAYAQDCVMPISIQLDEAFTNVPAAAKTMLYQSLSRVATENGLTTDSPTTPFVLTAHCDVLDKSNLPGPPIKTVYNLGITFYMADTYTQKNSARHTSPLTEWEQARQRAISMPSAESAQVTTKSSASSIVARRT